MIFTERLLLIPLKHHQLVQYIQNNGSLEAALGLHHVPRIIEPELKEALEQTLLPNMINPQRSYLFCTLWTVINRAEQKMVGDICIVDEPHETSEIEIGYGTYEGCRNKGYMTEAVGGLLEWAKTRPELCAVFAATEKSNVASCAVLQKNGFAQVDEVGTLLHWRVAV